MTVTVMTMPPVIAGGYKTTPKDSAVPQKKRISGTNVHHLRGKVALSDDEISARAKQAIGLLTKEFAAFSKNDRRATVLAVALIGVLKDHFTAAAHGLLAKALQQVNEILGRPSGSSPPKALPASPPEWWRNRKPGKTPMTPDKWIEAYYKPYIDAGLLTRSFFQQNGQDKTFYVHLLEWEKTNTLPKHLHIPTKSELLNREVLEMGGNIDTLARHGARLYQAARRNG